MCCSIARSRARARLLRATARAATRAKLRNRMDSETIITFAVIGCLSFLILIGLCFCCVSCGGARLWDYVFTTSCLACTSGLRACCSCLTGCCGGRRRDPARTVTTTIPRPSVVPPSPPPKTEQTKKKKDKEGRSSSDASAPSRNGGGGPGLSWLPWALTCGFCCGFLEPNRPPQHGRWHNKHSNNNKTARDQESEAALIKYSADLPLLGF